MPRLLVVLLGCFTGLNALQTIQVNLVYRHGDRSALRSFPKDVNQESSWPQGYGQLSKIGMQQHYELGRFLKKRYKDLLSPSYVNSEISVRSTDIDRALMSAYSNLAGFYPPTDSQTWNPDVDWQPIPVHTVPIDTDVLLGQASCVRYTDLMMETRKSAEVGNVTTRYRSFFDALSDLSGAAVNDLFAVGSLYDSIFCEAQHNLSVPEWRLWSNITGDGSLAFDTMSSMADLVFKFSFDSKEKQRLTGGTLVGKICQNMDAVAANTSVVPKMYMYSAHDTTVAMLLSALNVYDSKKPMYTATVMVELQKDAATGQLYVAVFYKNGVSVQEPMPLHVPGCDIPCPLTMFKSLTAGVVPTDWNSECRNRIPLLTQTEIIVISVCACITLCLAMATIICYARRRRGTSEYKEIPSTDPSSPFHP